MPNCEIGRGARLHKCVVDSGIIIPPGLIVGENPQFDAQRFRVSEQGVCLITQPMIDALAR
jgi:glucose-1-phosphate adenylyltransferase